MKSLRSAVAFLILFVPVPSWPASTGLVISQIYGGGGNSASGYNADYVEVHNNSAATISLSGMSLQYAPSTFGNAGTLGFLISGAVPAGGYYLIQVGPTNATGAALPTADFVVTNINLSQNQGKLALVNTFTLLPAVACPVDASIVDFIGWGAIDCSETAPTGLMGATAAAIRNNGGCAETDNNAADFTVTTPNPRNSATAVHVCGAVPTAPLAVNATAGDGQATVSWLPPFPNPTPPTTTYTVTSSPGGVTASAALGPITVTGLTNGTAYTFTVTATNLVGTGPPSAPSNSVTPAATTAPGAPTGVSAAAGNAQATVTFTAPASNGGSAITGYTVTSNPGAITGSGASSPITVTGLANGTAYTFTVTATNAIGTGSASAASNSVTPTGPVTSPIPRLANISTRLQVLTGNDVMIGGFVIGGASSKTVAIVATGPLLLQFGIPNALANPKLTLVRSSDQVVIATNDDWQADGLASQLQASGFAPSNLLEPGLYRTLPPGAYTAIVEGVGGGTGVSVIGVYEIDQPATPLTNISTRGRVLTGNDVMIGGFVIQGSGPQTVAIVATGPSLAQFGISSPLANPKITLVRSSDQAVVDTNDDWQSHPNASQLTAAGFAPSNALEAGIYTTLQPGAYTAIVEGVGGGTGVAVIGVYKVN